MLHFKKNIILNNQNTISKSCRTVKWQTTLHCFNDIYCSVTHFRH